MRKSVKKVSPTLKDEVASGITVSSRTPSRQATRSPYPVRSIGWPRQLIGRIGTPINEKAGEI
jgi:hypothetical protein